TKVTPIGSSSCCNFCIGDEILMRIIIFWKIISTKVPITKAFRKLVQIYKMKRLIFVIPVLFIAILSCTKSKPKGILYESEMADMMTEVYTVDGYLNVVDIDSARKLLPVLYQHVFDRYKIDSTQFDQNVDYYYGNPVMLEKLMTEVQKQLTEQEREARRQDSISQVQVRDSIMVVQRWRQLEQEAKDRILSVHIDTTMRYDLV